LAAPPAAPIPAGDTGVDRNEGGVQTAKERHERDNYKRQE